MTQSSLYRVITIEFSIFVSDNNTLSQTVDLSDLIPAPITGGFGGYTVAGPNLTNGDPPAGNVLAGVSPVSKSVDITFSSAATPGSIYTFTDYQLYIAYTTP